MIGFSLAWLLDLLGGPRLLVWLLWGGLGVLTVTLVVLMQTRWGDSQPLRKCLILSIWAHVLLAVYACTVQIVLEPPGHGTTAVTVHVVDPTDADLETADEPARTPRTWDTGAAELPDVPAPQSAPAELPDATRAADAVDDADALPRPKSAPPKLAQAPRRTAPAPPAPPATDEQPLARAPQTPPAELAARPPERREATDTPTPPPVAVPAPPRPELAAETPAATPAMPEPPRNATPPEPVVPQAPVPTFVARDGELPLVHEEQMPAVAGRAAAPTPPPLPAVPSAATPAALAALALESPLAGAVRELVPPPMPPTPTPAAAGPVPTPSPIAAAPSPATEPLAPVGPPTPGPSTVPAPNLPVPAPYAGRVDPERLRRVEQLGGSEQTELAVARGLAWLAQAQSPDGRWDASRFGAGREDQTHGHHRGGAGTEADTGMTGLALLAFLAGGHTSQHGPYRDTVERGLGYLLRSQGADGNLGGAAETFAFMYCHGMATVALGEAYGLTRDPRLEGPLRKAMVFTLNAQNPVTGGWRYRPGEMGDMSQFGWQVMALHSAHAAGMEVPRRSEGLMLRYLAQASSGAHGGLAGYRIGELPTRPMTAEALFCRQLLGYPREHLAMNEAGEYLLAELPGQGERNYYFWYYGTVAMFQLQGPYWERWNAALTHTLLASQVREGEHVGSWEPNDVWGGYGGRVYSTALATLSLEVYYRYLPLYGVQAQRPVDRR